MNANIDLFVSKGYGSIVVALRGQHISAAVAEADWHDHSNAWWVARVLVQAKYRGQGYGTRIMTELCKLLDDAGDLAYLVPNPYDQTISLRRLKQFYQRFGFVRTDTLDGPVWVRAPKGDASVAHFTLAKYQEHARNERRARRLASE